MNEQLVTLLAFVGTGSTLVLASERLFIGMSMAEKFPSAFRRFNLARAQRIVDGHIEDEALSELARNAEAIRTLLDEIGPDANGKSFRTQVFARFDQVDERLRAGDGRFAQVSDEITTLSATSTDHETRLSAVERKNPP